MGDEYCPLGLGFVRKASLRVSLPLWAHARYFAFSQAFGTLIKAETRV